MSTDLPRPLLRLEYARAAEDYLRSLPLEHFMEATPQATQREITVENIQKTTCEYFNIKIGDLKAKRRTQNIALPRQVAMYLCRKHTETSFPAIGDKFGGRDHSTVIHASKTVERKIKEDPNMQTTVEKLERNLNIRKKL